MRRRHLRYLFGIGCGMAFWGSLLQDKTTRSPIILGQGDHSFLWVHDWAQLPEGMSFGNTHGCVIVDSRDRVYVNTDTKNAVMVFEADGTYVGSWGEELAGGLHGMSIVREGEEEVLYLTHIGLSQVFKATLEGEILWSLGYPAESKKYASANEYRPTSIAVAGDGGFFVADGYGKSWIHRYDKDRNYLGSFGGRGKEPGQLRTPHGLWLETEVGEPHLVVSDRGNQRLQRFDLEGNLIEVVEGHLRRPCHTHGYRDELVVADLDGRVTLLDRKGRLLTHLGENPDPDLRGRNAVAQGYWRPGEFLAPHCANWDSKGNLYVMDWVSAGRVNKLTRR